MWSRVTCLLAGPPGAGGRCLDAGGASSLPAAAGGGGRAADAAPPSTAALALGPYVWMLMSAKPISCSVVSGALRSVRPLRFTGMAAALTLPCTPPFTEMQGTPMQQNPSTHPDGVTAMLTRALQQIAETSPFTQSRQRQACNALQRDCTGCVSASSSATLQSVKRARTLLCPKPTDRECSARASLAFSSTEAKFLCGTMSTEVRSLSRRSPLATCNTTPPTPVHSGREQTNNQRQPNSKEKSDVC